LSPVRDKKIAWYQVSGLRGSLLVSSGFLRGFFGTASGFPEEISKRSRRNPEENNRQTIRTGEDESAGAGTNKSLVGYYQTTKSSSKTVHICAVIREFPALEG
jgi:hypothetical protein